LAIWSILGLKGRKGGRQSTPAALRLLPGARLEAHRGSRRPATGRPQGLERPLHLLIAAGEALRPELAEQDDPIPTHLRAAPLQKRAMGVDRRHVHPWRPRLPGAAPPPALDRLLVDPQLARDRLDLLPAGQPCQHLAHDVFSQHQPSTGGVPIAGVEPTSL
jgi:hypothetical protein